MTNPKPCPDEPPGPITPTRLGAFELHRLTDPQQPAPAPLPRPGPPTEPHFDWFATSPNQPLPGPGDEGTDQPRELVAA